MGKWYTGEEDLDIGALPALTGSEEHVHAVTSLCGEVRSLEGSEVMERCYC